MLLRHGKEQEAQVVPTTLTLFSFCKYHLQTVIFICVVLTLYQYQTISFMKPSFYLFHFHFSFWLTETTNYTVWLLQQCVLITVIPFCSLQACVSQYSVWHGCQKDNKNKNHVQHTDSLQTNTKIWKILKPHTQ